MGTDRGEQRLYLEAEHADVRAAVDRVTRRRLDYLRGLLVELGLDEVDAERKAALGLSAAIGMEQLMAGAPGAMHRPSRQRAAYVDFLYAILVSPAPRG